MGEVGTGARRKGANGVLWEEQPPGKQAALSLRADASTQARAVNVTAGVEPAGPGTLLRQLPRDGDRRGRGATLAQRLSRWAALLFAP